MSPASTTGASGFLAYGQNGVPTINRKISETWQEIKEKQSRKDGCAHLEIGALDNSGGIWLLP